MLKEAYHRKEDGDVKERLVLVMGVRADGIIALEASEELHRTKGGHRSGSRDLNRGLEGLRDKPREGSHSFTILGHLANWCASRHPY